MEPILSPKPMLWFLFILVLLSSLPCSSATYSAAEFNTTFIHCLINTTSDSSSSHPITESIFTPNNASFSSVLQSYIRNLRFNTSTTKKPLLIITALDVSHVRASILCAQKHNMLMKIRSGGHDYEGVSYVTHNHVPFFILDMFNLRSIKIDIETETAWVQVGATLGELYYNIAHKSKIHGFPAGVGPNVGVGGHLSGGGYGNMMRKYGLSVDNVLDAQIIDVQGRLLDRDSMGEDLFWAIRGGGGASFGVVLSYKIKLVRVPETVTVFQVPRTLEQNATELVYNWQYFAPNTDPNLFIRLILEVANGAETLTKTIRATFVAMFLGDSKSLVTLMNETFPQMGLRQQDCIETTWLKSVLFWDNMDISTTPVEILLERTPQYTLKHLKRKSDYVRKPISKAGWEGIWKKMIELENGAMYFNPYGGRMAEIPSNATPIPHRAGNLWKIQYHANWNQKGKEVEDQYINMIRELHRYMSAFVSKNPRQAYFNYKDLDLGINYHGKNSYYQGRVYGYEYFKDNFIRLVQIKTKVDPNNFFRNEQSVPVISYMGSVRMESEKSLLYSLLFLLILSLVFESKNYIFRFTSCCLNSLVKFCTKNN